MSQFDKDFERTPANHRELFDLAVLRLVDLKAELEDGDTSIASVLINAKRETEVRNYIGAWCRHSSLGRYVIPQEEELADAKRPDLRWHGLAFNGPVPTELKIADKWTGPQLFSRLNEQLAGDYLRDPGSSCGVYLLVYRGLRKHWQLPDGKLVAFDRLVSALQHHWTTLAPTHSGIEEIQVLGIDLTKRVKSPVPKKITGRGRFPKNESANTIIINGKTSQTVAATQALAKKTSSKAATVGNNKVLTTPSKKPL